MSAPCKQRPWLYGGDIGEWDISLVNDTSYLFCGNYKYCGCGDLCGAYQAFNEPLAGWNTSSVIRMDWMFRSAFAYNQPLSTWDTSSVTRMDYMFRSAYAYNQPLSSWDTSSVITMEGMFRSASTYNQGERPSCKRERDAYFSFVISLLPTLQES